MKKGHLPRRTFLRGAGALLALPALECMSPVAQAASKFTGKSKGGAPVRMAFIYSPNGRNMPLWTPKGEGKNYQLSPTLQPLAKHKGAMQVLSGLDHDKAKPNGDGGGDHARANATFLTGCQAKKTSGADIKIGVLGRPDCGCADWRPDFAALTRDELRRDPPERTLRLRLRMRLSVQSLVAHRAHPHGAGARPAGGFRAPVRQCARQGLC